MKGELELCSKGVEINSASVNRKLQVQNAPAPACMLKVPTTIHVHLLP